MLSRTMGVYKSYSEIPLSDKFGLAIVNTGERWGAKLKSVEQWANTDEGRIFLAIVIVGLALQLLNHLITKDIVRRSTNKELATLLLRRMGGTLKWHRIKQQLMRIVAEKYVIRIYILAYIQVIFIVTSIILLAFFVK